MLHDSCYCCRKLQADSGSSSDSSDDPGVRRSVITGKRIMMNLDRTNEDHARERGRKQLLQFMNSQFWSVYTRLNILVECHAAIGAGSGSEQQALTCILGWNRGELRIRQREVLVVWMAQYTGVISWVVVPVLQPTNIYRYLVPGIELMPTIPKTNFILGLVCRTCTLLVPGMRYIFCLLD